MGSNVSNIQLGQIVAAESIQACFKCLSCRDGHLNQCENIELIGLTLNGAMAQFAKVKAAHCYPIDSILEQFGVEFGTEAGTLLEPLGCAYNALYINGPGLGPNDRVAIFGAGPIGLSFVTLARAANVSQIITFDLIDERLKLAKELGADLVYDSNVLAAGGTTPDDVIDQATKGKGVTIAVEAAGAVEVFSPALRALKARGTLIYVGRTPLAIPFDSNHLVSSALRIVGSRGHAGYNIYPTLINMIANKQIKIMPFITTRFRFDDVLGAMQQARHRNNGKVAVRVSNS